MSTKDMLDIAKERFVSFDTERAKTAALISIAEELRGLKAILCNATTLGGAIKLSSDDDLEQISNHLDDVGSVLLNARGPDGAIKVAQ